MYKTALSTAATDGCLCVHGFIYIFLCVSVCQGESLYVLHVLYNGDLERIVAENYGTRNIWYKIV